MREIYPLKFQIPISKSQTNPNVQNLVNTDGYIEFIGLFIFNIGELEIIWNLVLEIQDFGECMKCQNLDRNLFESEPFHLLDEGSPVHLQYTCGLALHTICLVQSLENKCFLEI